LQELEDELAAMRQELAAAREVAVRASSTWDKFRKERDFHRMHHKRVAQEKNKLITDIKRLKVWVRSSALVWLEQHYGQSNTAVSWMLAGAADQLWYDGSACWVHC
jgi:hypothetical protein